MKINNQKTFIELNDYLKGIKDKTRRQTDKVKDVDKIGADRVEISQRSREIQKLREVVEAVPDIRETRVSKLKKSIENETYDVKGEAIAGNMLKKSLINSFLFPLQKPLLGQN